MADGRLTAPVAALVVGSVARLVPIALALVVFACGGPAPGTAGSGSPTPSPAAGSPAGPSPAGSPSAAAGTYVVKRGDTLTRIAQRAKLTLDQLLAANPEIKDPNKIKIGQRIRIPTPGSAPAAASPS